MSLMEPAIERPAERGPIAWMARNHVAANLLMAFFLIGGLVMSARIKQEVFPEVDLDRISIEVPYPGASPAEVEQGIVLPIEEAVRGLDGVKRVVATASEGLGRVEVELLLGADDKKLLQDVKNAVDRIVSFPQDSERPIVSLMTNRNQVLSVVVYGDADEMALRKLANDLREELLRDPRITLVELSGARPMEISVEIPHEQLRSLGLRLEDVAQRVGRSALELPGGGVKTPGGEVLLRLAERRDLGREFENLPLVSRPDGTELRLGDVARIVDGFSETDQAMSFDGLPAQMVVVFRVGRQTPGQVADAVRETLARWTPQLPPGIRATIWADMSEMYRDRIDLLLRNGRLGLVLVMVLLGLFLEVRLAFWVTLGIPVSFLGAFLFMPAMDVSINMISLFAFIVTLGIVVDDAVVVGENVYELRQRGLSSIDAAIRGAREIAMPVAFSILTNIAAFLPLFFVPGTMGKFFRVTPAIVVAVFLVSWIESMFVLPAHLSLHKGRAGTGHRHTWVSWLILAPAIDWLQTKFSAGLRRFIEGAYAPILGACTRQRYVTLAVGVACLILAVGWVVGERIDFVFMPRVESDVVAANATLPYGSPVEATVAVEKRLLDAAREILAEEGGVGEDGSLKIVRGILSQVGNQYGGIGPSSGEAARSGSHLSNVTVYLVPSSERKLSAARFEDLWRRRVGEIPGVETIKYASTAGPAGQAAIDVELSHAEIASLEAAASELAEELKTFGGVTDVDRGFSPGKPQLDFKVRPDASSLGLTAADIGRQVRAAFFGAEALRQQRGRDEVRVYVRLPLAERKSEHNVEELLIRPPGGGEIPLYEAAQVIRGRAYTTIRRADGRRVLNVTAEVEEGVTTSDKVLRGLRGGKLQGLLREYPGLTYGLEGRQREQRESVESLFVGFSLALLAIFAMLAIPFRSYIQPAIIMTSIPFGLVGALLGHMLMGYDLSLVSLMGVVALSGVVVNDSLVLVHAANRYRSDEGCDAMAAVRRAGARRFRPILLTSLTTFLGLAPMIFETSLQARFLIPMALSLGFGILFSTAIALLLVPALYLILEDAKRLAGAAFRFLFDGGGGPESAPAGFSVADGAPGPECG